MTILSPMHLDTPSQESERNCPMLTFTLSPSTLSPGTYLAKTGTVLKGNARDPVEGITLYLDKGGSHMN